MGGGGITGGATGTVKLRRFGFDGRRSARGLSVFSELLLFEILS